MGKVRSVKVKKLKESVPVYDITVEKYHNFAVGKNKNIVHNCEYLHGDISGSIVSMAKNFAGTNNIPLLTREGNFGTRFKPEASANRYIFTAKENIFEKIFNKVDNNILIHQEFEGTKIEPRFYVPALPMILINGSEGIATGFAQKILPRNPETILEWLKSYENSDTVPDLVPYFNGFDGIIEKGDSENQWLIKGTFERTSGTRIIITELPIGYNLTSYTKVLDDLEDKKIIRSYTDLSENDTFKFEVVMESKILKSDDETILNKLKLIKKVTENFTVMNENNRVVIYTSPEEVIKHYIRVKEEYLQKRKDYLIKSITDELHTLASKCLFIKNVNEEQILVNKKKKADIIAQLEPFDKIIEVDGSYDYLLRMPIYSITEGKMQEFLDQIEIKRKEIVKIRDESIQETWFAELNSLGI